MPSTAGSMAYKPSSRPMGVVGVGGVGEQQQRRAMGDSSHYEEIALIGNGTPFYFHSLTKKQNGGQLVIRWGSNRYSIFNLISLSLFLVVKGRSYQHVFYVTGSILFHEEWTWTNRRSNTFPAFSLTTHSHAHTHFGPFFLSLSLSFLNDYIYIVIILGKIGRTKKAFRVNFYQTGKWGMFRGWSEYVAIFS